MAPALQGFCSEITRWSGAVLCPACECGVLKPLALETDRPFPEPALFVVRPDGNVQIAEAASAPFVRPDPDTLLGGLKFIQESGYPVRGTGG